MGLPFLDLEDGKGVENGRPTRIKKKKNTDLVGSDLVGSRWTQNEFNPVLSVLHKGRIDSRNRPPPTSYLFFELWNLRDLRISKILLQRWSKGENYLLVWQINCVDLSWAAWYVVGSFEYYAFTKKNLVDAVRQRNNKAIPSSIVLDFLKQDISEHTHWKIIR